MSVSSAFIRRPVGTTLLTIAIALAGALAYFKLPVSPLPQVDYPSIQISANLPGASPEVMASAIATPLERQFGRIAGVTEMTSSSYLGSTSITLVFELNRNIDAAARDVQAAINAARGQLPAALPTNPSYRKINPADSPVMIISVASEYHSKAKMYDVCSSILVQKLAQVKGVGQVSIFGGALPAVRVEVNPNKLNHLKLSMEDVRQTLLAANANRPKGQIDTSDYSITLSASDQLFNAAEYGQLILQSKNGAPVRLADVAEVLDSVEDTRSVGLANGKPALSLIIFRQPGGNMIDAVDQIRAMMPQLRAMVPAGINLDVSLDRTTSIRDSVRDVKFTLVLSIVLVIMVVFLFLRDLRSTLIACVAVPVSLIGTCAVMYLFDYSIDNLSLMALTIATGFVVDDAIVVLENITRHIEAGMKPFPAALLGAREIGFTVISISISLVAVFIPIFLMGGYVGRLFREFAITLSASIIVSMVISLTTTPMMCALFLKRHIADRKKQTLVYRASEWVFDAILGVYERTLRWVLRHQFLMILVTISTIALSVYLYSTVRMGLFPQQNTGRLFGSIIADQDASFQAMEKILERFSAAVQSDDAVESVIASTGGNRGSTNTGMVFVTLKPFDQIKITADQVRDRLRGKLSRVPGATLNLQSAQDVRVGARPSPVQFQFTLQDEDLAELYQWAPKLTLKLRAVPGIADVTSDQQLQGLQLLLNTDRTTAARIGNISQLDIDNILNNAFGQRQVSTIYKPLNQYRVILEVAPEFRQNPDALKEVYLKTKTGEQVPLSAVTKYGAVNTALAVNHSGQFPSVTISFNLLPGVSLSQAISSIQDAQAEIGFPASIHGSFSGTAQAFEAAKAGQVWLIAAAILTVYLVLGMLYESLIHPITILSTIPSAGVGALLALTIFKMELNIIGLIGIILLIGIVKKNAIMMIDFAIEAQRTQNKSAADAIFQACLLRFRPITMTTMAALLGGLPMAVGFGAGGELRRPLGVTIVGGLIFSQLLTLYTTPVIYLYMDRFRLWCNRTKSPAMLPETC